MVPHHCGWEETPPTTRVLSAQPWPRCAPKPWALRPGSVLVRLRRGVASAGAMPVARRRSPLAMRQKDRPSQASPARRLMTRAARPELEMQRGAVPGRRDPRYRLSPTPPWLRLVPVTWALSHRAGGFSRARLGPVLATTHLFLWESGRLHFTLSASPLTRGISLSGACGATGAVMPREALPAPAARRSGYPGAPRSKALPEKDAP